MSIKDTVTEKLTDASMSFTNADYQQTGYHIEVMLKKEQVRPFADIMLKSKLYLDFVTAVHVKTGLRGVYQFGCFTEPLKISAKTEVATDSAIPTISDIFHGADWHERETFDFYGVNYEGHADLRTLLLDDSDVDFKPLLKDEKKLKDISEITPGAPKKAAAPEKGDNKKKASE